MSDSQDSRIKQTLAGLDALLCVDVEEEARKAKKWQPEEVCTQPMSVPHKPTTTF